MSITRIPFCFCNSCTQYSQNKQLSQNSTRVLSFLSLRVVTGITFAKIHTFFLITIFVFALLITQSQNWGKENFFWNKNNKRLPCLPSSLYKASLFHMFLFVLYEQSRRSECGSLHLGLVVFWRDSLLLHFVGLLIFCFGVCFVGVFFFVVVFVVCFCLCFFNESKNYVAFHVMIYRLLIF